MMLQTPGQKIKAFRKLYNIRQYELCGDIITRNMLSMIENDKTPLIPTTAKKLILHIQELCSLRTIPCTLTLQDLLATPELQAKELTYSIINELSQDKLTDPINNLHINELFLLQDNYSLHYEKALLNYAIGCYFHKKRDFMHAYRYYLKALNNSSIFKECNQEYLSLAYLRAMYCCNQLNLLQDIIHLYNLYYLYLPNQNTAYDYDLLYNLTLAYKKLDQPEKALCEIQNIETIYFQLLKSDKNKQFKLLLIKANILKDAFLYEEAIITYEKILSLCQKDTELYIITLLNLAELFRLKEDTQKVTYYLHSCDLLLDSYLSLPKKNYEASIFLNLALNTSFLKQYVRSENYFLEALNKLHEGKEIMLVCDVFKGLHNLIHTTQNYNLLTPLRDTFLNHSLKELLLHSTLPFELIQSYARLGDLKNIDYLNTIILESTP